MNRRQILLGSGLVALGAIVGDVLDGVDVPARLRDQWKQQSDAYQRAVRAAAGSSN